MGKGVCVYLGFAELAVVCVLLGWIFSVDEYLDIMKEKVDFFVGDLYWYLNFD